MGSNLTHSCVLDKLMWEKIFYRQSLGPVYRGIDFFKYKWRDNIPSEGEHFLIYFLLILLQLREGAMVMGQACGLL